MGLTRQRPRVGCSSAQSTFRSTSGAGSFLSITGGARGGMGGSACSSWAGCPRGRRRNCGAGGVGVGREKPVRAEASAVGQAF